MSGNDFIDIQGVTDDAPSTLDWVNLPHGARAVSLWDCLHDAEVISIQSSLLERTMSLLCEIEHLRLFRELDEGFQFILQLEGVQSARAVRSAIWPGACSVPDGVSREEERRIIGEYQSKWREESVSWTEFEASVGRKSDRVVVISNAALVVSLQGPMVLRLCGQLTHAPDKNYATYHEVSVRAERMKSSGSDGRHFGLEEFRSLGETYWSSRAKSSK